MAKDAAAAKPEKKKVVNLHDVGKLQEVRDLGFRVDANDGVFSAVRGDEGTDEWEYIGPCDSASALITKVKLEARPQQFTERSGDAAADLGGGNVELTEDSKGQQYFPGTGPIVNAELNAAALEHFNCKNTRMEWNEKEKEAKETLTFLSHKNEDLFKTDTDTGKRFYRAGDIIVELIVEEKENVKTRLATEDDD